MKWREQALNLLEKAGQDEFVMDKLMSDPASPDEAIGFHGQQAAEKLLKAVLASAGIAYPMTHRLAELIDLINDAGLRFPERLHDKSLNKIIFIFSPQSSRSPQSTSNKAKVEVETLQSRLSQP